MRPRSSRRYLRRSAEPLIYILMESRLKNRATLLIAVLAALVVGGIVYAVQKKEGTDAKNGLQAQIDTLRSQLATAQKTTPTPSPTTTPVITTDQSTGTTTFTNANLGFSVRYPSSLTTDYTNDADAFSIDDPSSTGPTKSIASISATTTSQTLDQFVADLKTQMVLGESGKTTLGGTPAYEGVDQGIISQYGLYAVANGKGYILRFPTNDQETLAQVKSGLSSVQKSVISSFSFIK